MIVSYNDEDENDRHILLYCTIVQEQNINLNRDVTYPRYVFIK